MLDNLRDRILGTSGSEVPDHDFSAAKALVSLARSSPALVPSSLSRVFSPLSTWDTRESPRYQHPSADTLRGDNSQRGIPRSNSSTEASSVLVYDFFDLYNMERYESELRRVVRSELIVLKRAVDLLQEVFDPPEPSLERPAIFGHTPSDYHHPLPCDIDESLTSTPGQMSPVPSGDWPLPLPMFHPMVSTPPSHPVGSSGFSQGESLADAYCTGTPELQRLLQDSSSECDAAFTNTDHNYDHDPMDLVPTESWMVDEGAFFVP
jgi:hypothetical protein